VYVEPMAMFAYVQPGVARSPKYTESLGLTALIAE